MRLKQKLLAQTANSEAILLENVDSDQMNFLLQWLTRTQKGQGVCLGSDNYPKELGKLLDLLAIADYYDLAEAKKDVISVIVTNHAFMSYTNVRRIVLLECCDDDTATCFLMHEEVPLSLLVFLLTDP
jgi:hypothetical protein